jgi:hypothetical protein
MDCKHITGKCPEYCISYKKDKKKHCREPPRTTRSSDLSRRLIKHGLLQHSKDINSKLYMTYINIRSNLSKDQIKLLTTILKHIENKLQSLTKTQKIKLLNDLDLLNYVRLGNRTATKEELNDILNILGIYKTNTIIDVYNILNMVLLNEKEFIIKNSENIKRNITEKILIEHLANKSIDPKVFLSNPVIKTYVALKEQLSDIELTELEHKLEITSKQISTLKREKRDKDIKTLLEKENFCQYVRSSDNKPATKEQINTYLINLEAEDIISSKDETKCYILASIIATNELDVVNNYS